ncbi:MAG: hypothetical protein MJZ24_05675 [Paludibacteraceae bacterium]|nr:hypothetical protein [Paludibacteraceae bacterium]
MGSQKKEPSQNEYRRLGERIKKNAENISNEDLKLLQNYRITYRQPLATVFSELEQLAQRVDPNCVCAYRVKRIESIVSKLKRQPKMMLDRVGDIAGCRCIMSNIDAVYRLYNILIQKSDEKKLSFEIKGKTRDYNKEPSSNDPGYKSIHLYAHVGNRSIEIQLRDMSQHNWATLVEISDLIYKLHIKENGQTEENKDLFDFHFLLSKEKLNTDEMQRMADTTIKYNYLEKIGSIFGQNYLRVRQEWNKQNVGNKQFVLIATDSEGIPDFNLYSTFGEAEKAYFELYNNNIEGKNIVLTHIADRSFYKVSIAYSNYFMTYNNILFHVHRLLANLAVRFYNIHNIAKFKKYYSEYLRMIIVWFRVWKLDLSAFDFENKNTGHRRTVSKEEWYYSLMSAFRNNLRLLKEANDKFVFSMMHFLIYMHMKILNLKFVDEMKNEGLQIDKMIKL